MDHLMRRLVYYEALGAGKMKGARKALLVPEGYWTKDFERRLGVPLPDVYERLLAYVCIIAWKRKVLLILT